ncbi:MAG: RDD family protein [Planctomycetes bacterium]|nr:RDD family protein [Planctomycetota bacterium]
MKPEPDDDLPEMLRKRVVRQRSRLKFVRISFAITAVISVILLFAANQSQTLAPNARVLFVLPEADSLWLVDQHLDITNKPDGTGGSFALLHLDGDNLKQGERYDGLIRTVTVIGKNEIGITTPTRFMRFDTSGAEWELKPLQSLGINDPTASPLVVNFRETLWQVWTRGNEVMVQPFGRQEVAAQAVVAGKSPELDLQARVSDDAIWVSIIDRRSGDLSLLSFTPRIEAAVNDSGVDADRDADDAPDNRETDTPPAQQVSAQKHFNQEVTGNVKRASFAIIETPDGARPVVAFLRNEDTSRKWHLMVWTRDSKSSNGNWVDAEPPAREKPPAGLELTNFVTLASRGQNLIAVYSEAGKVRMAETTLASDGALEWSQPKVLPIDQTNGPTAYIVWISLLFGVVLIMASQGVWLMLNRERAMDRTLADILEKHEKQKPPEQKEKELPKLLYANPFARALSLMLDVAMTSPIVILLQGIYGYEWEQAYGFLAVGSTLDLQSTLVPTLEATLVTLLVLSIYSMVCELLWGRTFGKLLFRLRVVDADGEPPAAWRIVVRNALKIFELIHWAVLMIPMGLMMLTGKQQRLGDLAAGTFVIVDVVPDEAPDDIDI